MKSETLNSERGQAIVLLVLAMVVLLGFTALAVDGSMVYSDRRYTQNGSDAASLAGGGTAAQWFDRRNVTHSNFSFNDATKACLNDTAFVAQKARLAAIKRADDNDFTIDQNISDNNGVETLCGEDPITGTTEDGGTFVVYRDRYMDVRTMITHDTETAFAHFVFPGLMRNTVTSVTRVRPTQPLAFGYAIVALNKENCISGGSAGQNGLQFRGNLTMLVERGGLFSNGCLDVDGGTTPRIEEDPNCDTGTCIPGVVYFDDGNNLDNIEFYNNAGAQITSGEPLVHMQDNDAFRIPSSTYDLPVPNCTGHTYTFNQIKGKHNLKGLYCISDDVRVNSDTESFSGTDMTIVMMGDVFLINGGTVSVQAPPRGYSGPAISGVAVYLPKQYYGPTDAQCGSTPNEVQINGNALNGFIGTILAPCSNITLEGGASTFAYQSQVIGWNVDSGGTADVNVVYDSDSQATLPSMMDLWR